jgi:hypothetical protein
VAKSLRNREYHRRARWAGAFEKAGRRRNRNQLRLDFDPRELPSPAVREETFEEALHTTFPVRPASEDELAAEFHRLFPP